MKPSGGQTGIALVAVLWIISGLAVVVATVLAQTRTDVRLTRTHVDLAKARTMAEAGIYRGVYELLRSRDTVRFGLPETMPRLTWDDSVVAVRIRNEAGKIDVNTAPEALIRSMFAKAGVSAARTRQLAEQYSRLRGFDDGSAVTQSRHTRFASIEAFAARMNLSPKVWQTISSWITVHNGQPGVNPYVADEEVLAIIPGFNPALLDSPFRRGSPDRLRTRSTRPARQYFTDRLSPVYTIAARATVGGVSTTVEATIEMSAHRNRPYTILAWNETPRFRGG